MRQPFRHQILVPMAGVMLVTLASVSFIDAWLAARQSQDRIIKQLQGLSATIEQSSFPLTDRVLRQMSGLSGAEFVVTGPNGKINATSYVEPVREQLLLGDLLTANGKSPQSKELQLDQRGHIGGEHVLHGAFDLTPLPSGRERGRLHVIYPLALYENAWWEAAWPRSAVGIASLLVVVGVSHWIANRMTRPLFRVRDHMEQIAGGRFEPIEVPQRDDEIRDLSLAMNHTASMLAEYEQQVRRDEQLRILGRLGGAMAHQVRNAVTGCRLALEFHREDCELDDEALQVAIRQLDLLEGSLRRFLTTTQRPSARREQVDIGQLIETTLPLVAAQARHFGVRLHCSVEPTTLCAAGEPEALREVLVNLLLNAIDAAASPLEGTEHAAPEVLVKLEAAACDHLRLVVVDSGQGPPPELRERLFEPLVSSKPEGAGLGLAVARQIVNDHQGRIAWDRSEGQTRFVVELPLAPRERADVQVAGC